MKLAMLALLITPRHPGADRHRRLSALGTESISTPARTGLSQILYELSSSAANNGSGFEGLTAPAASPTTSTRPTLSLGLLTGVILLICRLCDLLPPSALAASLARKKPTGPLHHWHVCDRYAHVSPCADRAIVLIVRRSCSCRVAVLGRRRTLGPMPFESNERGAAWSRLPASA